ncbi:MAG: hypothetical protein WDM71_10285 [Ferruginibacter sp.]
MDIKKIQELIKLINKSNIGEITIEEEGTKITLKQKPDPVQNFIASSAPSMLLLHNLRHRLLPLQLLLKHQNQIINHH